MSERNVLPSLAQVVRALSVLFWAIPGLLLTSTACALDLAWRQFGYAPPVVSALALVYGLAQFRHFQPDEKIWVASRHRGQLLALILLALSPTPIWWSRDPQEAFFNQGMLCLEFAGIFFLIAINDVLLRLVAMLPDQTLRTETLYFTRLNVRFLILILFGLGLWVATSLSMTLPWWILPVRHFFEFVQPWLLVMSLILPVALTMTLLWKTKEAILHSVFRS